jgi:hypothetical protein
VAAGRHVVDLVYRPRSAEVGLAVTGAGLLIAAAAALSSRGGAGR